MSRANDRIWKYELARFEYSYKFEADFGLERREESKSKTEGSRRMLLFNVILHLHCFAMFGTAISGDSSLSAQKMSLIVFALDVAYCPWKPVLNH